MAANIETTRAWWETRRSRFTLYISQVVLDEAGRGDTEIAGKRLQLLGDFPLLEVSEQVRFLASQFLSKSNLPPKASDDALHIATATVYGLDYLLRGIVSIWPMQQFKGSYLKSVLKLAMICQLSVHPMN